MRDELIQRCRAAQDHAAELRDITRKLRKENARIRSICVVKLSIVIRGGNSIDIPPPPPFHSNDFHVRAAESRSTTCALSDWAGRFVARRCVSSPFDSSRIAAPAKRCGACRRTYRASAVGTCRRATVWGLMTRPHARKAGWAGVRAGGR